MGCLTRNNKKTRDERDKRRDGRCKGGESRASKVTGKVNHRTGLAAEGDGEKKTNTHGVRHGPRLTEEEYGGKRNEKGNRKISKKIEEKI